MISEQQKAKWRETGWQNSLKRLVKAVNVNAPKVIIGHFAVSVAARALTEEPSTINLIRFLIQWERSILEMTNPDSPEYAELQAIEKDLEDLELEQVMQDLEQ